MKIDFTSTLAPRGQLAEALKRWDDFSNEHRKRLEDDVIQAMKEAAPGHVLGFSEMRTLRPRGRDLLEYCDYLERRLKDEHPFGPAYSN